MVTPVQLTFARPTDWQLSGSFAAALKAVIEASAAPAIVVIITLFIEPPISFVLSLSV
jgi:hypothetical protein